MVVYSRWYIVPRVEHTDPETGIVDLGPKYKYEPGLTGFAGMDVSRDAVDDHYPALNITNPDVDRWYIVRFYGEDIPGWQALNAISVLGDTRNLATNPTDVRAVLEQRLPKLGNRPDFDPDSVFGISRAGGQP